MGYAVQFGSLLIGDVNAKGQFNGQAEAMRSAGREADIFLAHQEHVISLFPASITF
jgi:hypothetical protein